MPFATPTSLARLHGMNSLSLLLFVSCVPATSAILVRSTPVVRGTGFQSARRGMQLHCMQLQSTAPVNNSHHSEPVQVVVEQRVASTIAIPLFFALTLTARSRLMKRREQALAMREQTYRAVGDAVALFLLASTSLSIVTSAFLTTLLQGATSAKYDVELLAGLFVGAVFLYFATQAAGANLGAKGSDLV